MSAVIETPAVPAPARRITGRNIAIAAVAAVVVDLGIYGVASVAGADWDAGSPYPIGAAMVAMFSVVPLVLAALVVAAVARTKPGFQRFANWFGLVFAIVTIGGSFASAPQLLTACSLGLMHLVVGSAWFWLSRPGPRAA